jgi:glutamate-1-semialdehyde 2,1-aminomutase
MKKYKRSAASFERARSVFPGGVNSPVRAYGAVGGEPLIIVRGEGAHIYDLDDNEYLDYVLSWGPLILGHAHPAVVSAVQQAAKRGLSFGAPTEGETELGEMVRILMPHLEMLRLVSSGTEAVMTAARLARACTDRDLIVKFDGCYHGHSDGFLIRAGSGLATGGLPASRGVPAEIARNTISLPYNDVEAVRNLFARQGEKIAAVVVEPVAANMGVIPPKPDFLAGLREITRHYNSLLIFDEVITGFRVALGGAAELYGITPDLTCLGKILGGGMPVGAVGGRRDLMEQLAPSGDVYQAGTLSGNPISVAAGIATLRELRKPDFYPSLASATRALAEGLQQVFRRAGIPTQVHYVCGLLTVFFTPDPVCDFASARRCDSDFYRRFFHTMLERAVYLPPSPFEAWFLSILHDRSAIEKTLTALTESLSVLSARR